MTFKEKLMQDHPDWDEDSVNIWIIRSCPHNPMNGALIACPKELKNGPNTVRCSQCWDREIPETETNKKEKDIMATTRKTKDELCIELKEAEEKIMELTKELNDAKERERLQESADKVAQMRDAFVNAGFSKEEAFKLVLISIEAALGGR